MQKDILNCFICKRKIGFTVYDFKGSAAAAFTSRSHVPSFLFKLFLRKIRSSFGISFATVTFLPDFFNVSIFAFWKLVFFYY